MNRRHLRQLATFFAIWLLYAALVLRYWWVCDDAFISFRYARNWARGYGPRYNLGDHVPVEGYSNFLWMALASLFEALDLDPALWMPLLSFACGTLLLALVFRVLLARLEAPLPVAALAVLALATSAPFAVWSTGGLATMAHALLVFAAFDLLALRRDGRAAKVGAFALALGLALIRFEGIAWVVTVVVCAAVSRRLAARPLLRPVGSTLAVAGAGTLAYLAWRWSYYGALFPNTLSAKGIASPEALLRGSRYTALFFLTYVTPLLALPAATLAWQRKRRAVGVPALLFLGATLASAVASSGDFMTSFRFLIPFLLFFALLLGMLLQAAHARRPAGAWAAGGAVCVLGLLPSWNVHLLPASIREPFGVRAKAPTFRSEFEQWRFMVDNSTLWREKGLALREFAAPGSSLVERAVGNVGYYSELFIFDRNGLVTREVAERSVEGPLRAAGHDKIVPARFFLERRPALLESALVFSQQQAERKLAIWEARRFEGYAPELVVGTQSGVASEPRFLLVLRRLQAGELRSAPWAAFEERLAELPRETRGSPRGR